MAMKPEDFSVEADNDGDRYLACPNCPWEADFTNYPVDIRPHVPASARLGDLLEAARAHITEQHMESSDA